MITALNNMEFTVVSTNFDPLTPLAYFDIVISWGRATDLGEALAAQGVRALPGISAFSDYVPNRRMPVVIDVADGRYYGFIDAYETGAAPITQCKVRIQPGRSMLAADVPNVIAGVPVRVQMHSDAIDELALACGPKTPPPEVEWDANPVIVPRSHSYYSYDGPNMHQQFAIPDQIGFTFYVRIYGDTTSIGIGLTTGAFLSLRVFGAGAVISSAYILSFSGLAVVTLVESGQGVVTVYPEIGVLSRDTTIVLP